MEIASGLALHRSNIAHMARGSQVQLSRENPVRRVRHAGNLTLDKASSEAGCHLQAFFLQEQGVYPEILPAIRAWVLSKNYFGAATEYELYQAEKRHVYGDMFHLDTFELSAPSAQNPIVQLRGDLGLSRMAFAKRFCVHPGLLYRGEVGTSHSLPEQLRQALQGAGMKDSVLDELDYRIGE